VVEVPADPARARTFDFGLSALPDVHRAEVGAIRVGVADALEDGQLAIFEEVLHRGEVGMKANMVGDFQDGLGVNAEGGALAVVGVVGVGHDGVQAVIAAGELDDDEDLAVCAGGLLGALDVEGVGDGKGGLAEEGGDGRGDREEGEALLKEFATRVDVVRHVGLRRGTG
jgi:hypothetical protein